MDSDKSRKWVSQFTRQAYNYESLKSNSHLRDMTGILCAAILAASGFFYNKEKTLLDDNAGFEALRGNRIVIGASVAGGLAALIGALCAHVGAMYARKSSAIALFDVADTWKTQEVTEPELVKVNIGNEVARVLPSKVIIPTEIARFYKLHKIEEPLGEARHLFSYFGHFAQEKGLYIYDFNFGLLDSMQGNNIKTDSFRQMIDRSRDKFPHPKAFDLGCIMSVVALRKVIATAESEGAEWVHFGNMKENDVVVEFEPQDKIRKVILQNRISDLADHKTNVMATALRW